MPEEQESVQGKFFEKKSKVVEIRPQDRKTGQHKLFGVVEEFAPGFQDWAGLMTQRLFESEERNQRAEEQNEKLEQKLGENTEQSRRLANSLEQVIPKLINQVVKDEDADFLISAHKEGENADVAFIDGSLPAEATYTHITSDFAKLVGINHSRLGVLLKQSGIAGNPKFHHSFRTGNKKICQRYKITALDELLKRANNGDLYGIKPDEIEKLENYFQMKDLQV